MGTLVHGTRRRRARPIVASLLAVAALGAVLTVSAPAAGAAGVTADGPTPTSTPTPTQGTGEASEDAEQQAAVLAAEDRRLVTIRTITSLARWQDKNWKTPYRLGTAAGYTLVLTPKSAAYTVEDLLQLAPQTFQHMSDGSYLLSEHIVVMANATLRLSAPKGLTLRLASGHDGFATIVSLGGKLELIGEAGAPVRVSSWDVAASNTDSVVTDGRSYLRSIGGQFEARHVQVTQLGFWSGRTGGIALTGTDRPNTGAIESNGGNSPGPDANPSLTDGVTWQPAGALVDETGPDLDYTIPSLDYVSSRLSDVTVEQCAFGLFVSGANGVDVADSSFTGNDHGGVVFHRYVTNGAVSRTTSSDNNGDGFTLARATTGITISESTANGNTGSGFSLDGRALADGPSAVGSSLRSYGNNSVANSTATNNRHNGIEVLGGFNIGVSNNRVEGHDMGIVVSGPGQRVSVTGNTVQSSVRHGVALVDGVSDSTVTGNIIEGAATGIYLRDGAARITGNTIQNAYSHGVSVLGQADGAEVTYNVLAGSGASALDTSRADAKVHTSTNNLDGWQDTTPWYLWFKRLVRPMNVLWAIVVLLIVVSALRRRRGTVERAHPYADQLAMLEQLAQPRIDLTDRRVLAE